MGKTRTVAAEIPAEDWAILESISKDTGKSKTAILAPIISAYLRANKPK
jgi:predicted DNA-binding protein